MADSDTLPENTGNPVDDVNKALKNNPIASKEEDSEVEKSDYYYQLEMAKQDVAQEKLNNESRKAAMDQEIARMNSPLSTWLGKNISSILAIAATALCFGMFYALIMQPWVVTLQDNKQIITYILGVMSGILSQVFSYYFGSSSGSMRKSETLAKALETKDEK